jgi:hypothetical protein
MNGENCIRELHDLYSLPSIIRIIKSSTVRCAGYVARKGEKRNAYSLLVGKPEEDQYVGGCIWITL